MPLNHDRSFPVSEVWGTRVQQSIADPAPSNAFWDRRNYPALCRRGEAEG